MSRRGSQKGSPRGSQKSGGPGVLLAAASIAGVAPYGAQGLDWLAGMEPENGAEFGAALRGEGTLTEYLDGEAAACAPVSGADVAEALGGLVSPADQAALTGEFAGFIASAFRTAVSEGIAGWQDDDLAFARDWGFSVASRRRPSESPSGRETRTGWSRPRTASGWPRTSRARALTCSPARAT